MDELWQRYGSFWRPVLFGLGILLLGLIAVHVITPSPEDAEVQASSAESSVKGLVLPREGVGTTLRANAEQFDASVRALASAFDPSAAGGDRVQAWVRMALVAAHARGGVGASAFDGDAAAAEAALKDAERIAVDRTALFRTGNPNVAFSSLLSDVWNVLRTRANRADMDLEAELLGFASVTSVPREDLERRLANLALVARIVDVAIRNGAASVDSVTFDNPRSPGPDAFLQEWPVKVVLTAPAPCVEAVLEMLTDPRHPTAIVGLVAQQPSRAKAATGLVEVTLSLESVAVRPGASLDLDAQEGRS